MILADSQFEPGLDIFGDNLVKQVGVNSGSYKFTSVKGMPYIEIDDKELRITLDVACQIAERLEKNKRRPIPLSWNDKKPVEKVLTCFRFSPSDSISTVLKKFDLNSEPCEIDSLPSFIKPEFYEYGRVPGKPGGEKSKMRVDGRYVILAIAGWLLSRVGTAKMGNEWVGVHVFTTTKSLLYNAYGDFAGVKPSGLEVKVGS
jgi:CRISPR-associated protein CsaX